MTVRVINDDCLTALPRLAAEGFQAHACVTDPPYHLTSIVKRFGAADAAPAKHGTDGLYARQSRGFMGKQWDGGDVALRPETWRLVWDCLRPGAFLVAFGGTRTWHRQAVAIEDAGFEIRDTIMWLFGSGFPKSLDLGDGRGTALKPAHEPIVLARKPIDGTNAANVLAHGTGAINIDACRVGDEVRHASFTSLAPCSGNRLGAADTTAARRGTQGDSKEYVGRWPANVLHDGSAEVLEAFAAFGESKSGVQRGPRGTGGIWTPSTGAPCGPQHGDSGTAARFFYTAKADAADRAGSKHPTVKPTDLMRYLVTLVTPPGGAVLDPFAGSGSTGLAADQCGCDAVLIEREAEYAADIHRKISGDAPLFAEVLTA